MSHQGLPGWFPECFNCGLGNLGAVVCLVPNQEDQHEPRLLDERAPDGLFEAGGHWFKRCHLCEITVSADPATFGSLALCVACWNDFVTRGLVPPTSPSDLRRVGREGDAALRRWPR